MKESKSDKSVVGLFVLIVLVTFALYAIAISCSEVRAEWVRMSNFRGIETNATFKNIAFERARKSVAWHFGGNGELERTTFGWRNTRPYRSGSDAVEWFAKSRFDDDIFFYNGALNIYSAVLDTSRQVTLSYLDDVRQYATTSGGAPDSVIRRNNATSSGWLKLSLANITSIHVVSAGFDSTYETWGGPVNDTTWFIKKAARAMYNSDPDTVTLSSVSVDNTYGPPGTFLANDTTWITDGNTMVKQYGDSGAAVTYPSFIDTTTVSSFYQKYQASSDSDMILVGNFPDSQIANVATGRFWYQPMIDTFPRGQPITPYYGINNGPTDTLYFAVDTNYWGPYNTGVNHRRIRDASTCYVTRTSGPSAWSVTWTDTGYWDYRGVINGRVKWAVWTPGDVGQNISSIHDFDGRIVIAGGSTNPPTRQHLRIIKENDTLKVLIACDLNVGNNSAFRIGDQANHIMKLYEWPRQSVAVSVQDWSWRISCLHKFRAFYAGNQDTLSQLAWSGDNNYDSIAGTEMLEGDDPITALSSMDNLQVYRRHSIAQVSGTNPDDFYYNASPSGVGAVNNGTVQRDPYSATDYFINELGMWSNTNGSVQEVPTVCPEIFTDSINWAYERNFSAEIFDRKYWLTCMFGVPSSKVLSDPPNNRIVVIDLDGSDVTFETGMTAQSMYVHRVPGYTERLFIGDGDSTRIMEVGVLNNLGRESDWRSAWNDFESPNKTKRMSRAYVTFLSNKPDTLNMDFYVRNGTGDLDEATAATWTKTIIITTGSGIKRHFFPVSRDIVGDAFSVGFRSTDSGMVVIDAGLDIIPVGQSRMGRQ